MATEPVRSRIAPALVAVAAFAVYARLCPPVPGMGDASELTLVLATHGVAHPSGYPLYVGLGHLFASVVHALGVGWPMAAALWSAAGAAAAVGFLFELGRRLASGTGVGPLTRLLAALLPVGLFAFEPILVADATRAEVNSWSLAWACGTTLLFVRIVGALQDGEVRPQAATRRAAALWGLACGAGLAHHLTSILISLPFSAALIAILVRRRGLEARLVRVACGAALLPLASYGIIAWRAWHPARVQWPLLEPGFASVIGHITGAQYRHFIGYFAPTAYQKELLARVALPFLAPGSLMLLLGSVRARDRDWRLAWSALCTAFVLVVLFTFRYGVHDPTPYLLPAMALGVAATVPALAAIPGAGTRPGTGALAAAALASLLVIVPWLKDGLDERQATLDYERTIRSMWSAIPPDTAIVSWADDRYHRLIGYQILLGEKPALMIVTPDLFFANPVRRAIQERFGADPLEGFRPPRVVPGAPDEAEVIERHRMALLHGLNARARVPVILFDPARPIVFQLRKPWEPVRESGIEPAGPRR